MKYISNTLAALVISISLDIYAQEIVDETIDTQVSASSISQNAQIKIDGLDEQSKELLINGFLLDVIEKITDSETQNLIKNTLGLKE